MISLWIFATAICAAAILYISPHERGFDVWGYPRGRDPVRILLSLVIYFAFISAMFTMRGLWALIHD